MTRIDVSEIVAAIRNGDHIEIKLNLEDDVDEYIIEVADALYERRIEYVTADLQRGNFSIYGKGGGTVTFIKEGF